jgi:O-antigen ligase
MWDRLQNVWLPRLCFLTTLTMALALVAAVIAGPWLVPSAAAPLLLELFAQDGTVRRTALASAAGLLVTAFVFFRPTASSPKKSSPKEPRSGNMAGA